jgi:hypothetical protein
MKTKKPSKAEAYAKQFKSHFIEHRFLKEQTSFDYYVLYCNSSKILQMTYSHCAVNLNRLRAYSSYLKSLEKNSKLSDIEKLYRLLTWVEKEKRLWLEVVFPADGWWDRKRAKEGVWEEMALKGLGVS